MYIYMYDVIHVVRTCTMYYGGTYRYVLTCTNVYTYICIYIYIYTVCICARIAHMFMARYIC